MIRFHQTQISAENKLLTNIVVNIKSDVKYLFLGNSVCNSLATPSAFLGYI